MAPKKRTHITDQAGENSPAPTLGSSPVARVNPLVFISHDSRDADLAEAFDHLLSDASGGVVQTFRSSDQSGRAGIDYGENWYSKITKMLGDATDVVALLTPNSIGRPWILFEAGFAVGRLDAKVFGISLGIPLSNAVVGPFAQFQNCEANEDSLTGVVLQLIRRNPNARPREEAVRKQVSGFLSDIGPLLKQRGGQEETTEEMNATAVAKLFEEVKVMFRDLPSRVELELGGRRALRKPRGFHPMMFEELADMSRMEEAAPGVLWLLIGSLLRDEIPWFSEAVLDVHHAFLNGDPRQIEQAQRNLQAVMRLARHSRMFLRTEQDEEIFMFIRHLPEILKRLPVLSPVESRKIRREKAESESAAATQPKSNDK